MTAQLTLFTTCKPFEGNFARIQRNALLSWKCLYPTCEVLIFGDEPGVREYCQQLGFRRIPTVARSKLGTPLLNSLFEAAESETKADVLAFINADIMITSDLFPAVATVRDCFERFLMIVRRWNVEMEDEWNFEASDWENRLRSYALEHGRLEPPYGGVDLFIYRRGLWKELPAFSVGRTRWDSALIYEARKLRAPVIDATQVVTSVHQSHDYSHYSQQANGIFKGSEAVHNQSLLGGEEFIFTPLNATHIMNSSGIHRNIVLSPLFLLRKAATLPALYPALRPLAPLVRCFAPLWRTLRKSWVR